MLEDAEADARPLVKKAMDMALRATGKRDQRLRGEAIAVAGRLARSPATDRGWIGRHALRELQK
jgi:3-methyladenine DNA glycosylase AlkD